MPCIDTVQGFYFALLQYSHIQAFTVRFVPLMQLYHPHHKTVHRALQGIPRLFDPFQRTTIQQIHKPPMHRLHHTRGHTIKRSTSTDTRCNRHAGRCTGATCPPTIIMYIRVQRCAPVVDLCQAVQHSADHASGGGTVQRQGHGGRRGTTSGLPPRLFSGFRPIANRGQQ